MSRIVARGGAKYTLEKDAEHGCSYLTLSLKKIKRTISITDDLLIDVAEDDTIVGVEQVSGTFNFETLISVLQHIAISSKEES